MKKRNGFVSNSSSSSFIISVLDERGVDRFFKIINNAFNNSYWVSGSTNEMINKMVVLGIQWQAGEKEFARELGLKTCKYLWQVDFTNRCAELATYIKKYKSNIIIAELYDWEPAIEKQIRKCKYLKIKKKIKTGRH